jgi:spore coat polysaccharide biosynthesis protein SpsF
MLPLAGDHVITHDVRRLQAAETVDQVVVATSTERRDDILARYAQRAGASVHRGSEEDVLGRMYDAAVAHDADIVVRATGDNPLIPPAVVDRVVNTVAAPGGVNYAGNTLEKTFPLGLIAEAFDQESFETVEAESTKPHQREHVTQYYHENPDAFALENVVWSDVYGWQPPLGEDEVRLTLDESDDYELLRAVYEGVAPDERGIVSVREALDFVAENGLAELNRHVEQPAVQREE